MELAYNPLADKDIQMRFHELALADVKGPRLGAEIPSTMATHHPSKILPALDRLSNYNRNDIDLTIVDGMYCSDFVPECDESGTNHAEVNATFEAMFQQLQNVTSEESSQLFSAAISDAELPKMHASGTSVPVSARNALRSLVDTSYILADKVGPVGVQWLEETLRNFQQRCESHLEINRKENERNTRHPCKYVPITMEEYDGSADRVFNTRHMR